MVITFYFKDQSKEIATDLRCQKKRKCNPLSSLSFVERECWGFYSVWATVKKQQQTARCYLILSTLTACVFCTTTTQEIDCGGANLEVAWLMKVKVKQYYYYYCGSSPTRQAPLFATNSTRVDRVSRERNVSWLCGVAVCSIWRGVKKRKTLPRFSRLNASLRRQPPSKLQCALGSSWGQAGRHLVLVWSGECMPIGREVKSCLSIM